MHDDGQRKLTVWPRYECCKLIHSFGAVLHLSLRSLPHLQNREVNPTRIHIITACKQKERVVHHINNGSSQLEKGYLTNAEEFQIISWWQFFVVIIPHCGPYSQDFIYNSEIFMKLKQGQSISEESRMLTLFVITDSYKIRFIRNLETTLWRHLCEIRVQSKVCKHM